MIMHGAWIYKNHVDVHKNTSYEYYQRTGFSSEIIKIPLVDGAPILPSYISDEEWEHILDMAEWTRQREEQEKQEERESLINAEIIIEEEFDDLEVI